MINKTRIGWKRRETQVSNSKLVLALMILISMILLVGDPINSDLAPSTQDLDQGFFTFVQEQFIDLANDKIERQSKIPFKFSYICDKKQNISTISFFI